MNKEAVLYEKKENNVVNCFLCAHRCIIKNLKTGVCGVRKNIDGTLYTLIYGKAIAASVDPIEKKPLYHFLPGSFSFSVATVGCNFKCGFCQNWSISQVSAEENNYRMSQELSPREIVEAALAKGCRSISYTYTEPTIFFEYAYDTAVLAKKNNIYNVFVTNGYMTKETVDLIEPYLDAANIDLKSFNNKYYKKYCKASLQPVLDTIAYMREKGIWVEVTTLIIPGENDSESEMKKIAAFIAGVDPDIPWHISRFHAQYEFNDYPSTPVETLKKAKEIGFNESLRYIYLGNVSEGFDTYCYNCKKILIERSYFSAGKIGIEEQQCPYCGTDIAGKWE